MNKLGQSKDENTAVRKIEVEKSRKRNSGSPCRCSTRINTSMLFNQKLTMRCLQYNSGGKGIQFN